MKTFSEKLEYKLISDSTKPVKEELEEAIIKIKPSYCLFIGQAPDYNRVTLETIATNYMVIAPPVYIVELPLAMLLKKQVKLLLMQRYLIRNKSFKT